MINANISITGYFSLIECYPGLGNAYLSNLKNTLMNMGYTAAGWTYLADENNMNNYLRGISILLFWQRKDLKNNDKKMNSLNKSSS